MAKVRDDREELTRTAHELLTINLIMSVVAYIALAFALLTVRKLQDERTLYILMSSNNLISLTDKGYVIARKMYDRHQALTKYLVQLGVPDEIAQEDACRIEHILSDESFAAIRRQVTG